MSANFNFTSDTDLVGDFVEGSKPLAQTQAQTTHVCVDPPLKTMAPLSYDFDIVTVAPDAAQQAHLDALAALGQGIDDISVQARWRDPATAAALAKASRGVRELFKTAGFGTAHSESRMMPGTFAAENAEARHEIVMRLTNALAQDDAASFDWGQIDVTAFFKAHADATAVWSQPVTSAVSASSFNKQKIALIGLAVGISLLVVAGLAAL